MRNGPKLAIVAALGAAVALTFALRGGRRGEYAPATPAAVPAAPAAAGPQAPPRAAGQEKAPLATPRLLELGSNRCVSCQEMAKVLDALRASQGERLRVEFIDVFEDPDAADRYAIKLIPTQILYDGDGREIHRHTGYFSHDDILATFRELGVKL